MPKHRNKAGRKIKRRKGSNGRGQYRFTSKMRRLIYKAYEAGIPSQRRIAEMVGIDPGVLSLWLDRGKDPSWAAHYAFRQRIMRIQARREAEMLSCIEKCASGGQKIKETQIKINPKGREVKKRVRETAPQWQAAAWRLERWLPNDYGLKVADINAESSAADLAQEIQKAAMALDESVPGMETSGEE